MRALKLLTSSILMGVPTCCICSSTLRSELVALAVSSLTPSTVFSDNLLPVNVRVEEVDHILLEVLTWCQKRPLSWLRFFIFSKRLLIRAVLCDSNSSSFILFLRLSPNVFKKTSMRFSRYSGDLSDWINTRQPEMAPSSDICAKRRSLARFERSVRRPVNNEVAALRRNNGATERPLTSRKSLGLHDRLNQIGHLECVFAVEVSMCENFDVHLIQNLREEVANIVSSDLPSAVGADLVERLLISKVAPASKSAIFDDVETVLLDLEIAHSNQDLFEKNSHLVVVTTDSHVKALSVVLKIILEASELCVVRIFGQRVFNQILVQLGSDCGESRHADQGTGRLSSTIRDGTNSFLAGICNSDGRWDEVALLAASNSFINSAGIFSDKSDTEVVGTEVVNTALNSVRVELPDQRLSAEQLVTREGLLHDATQGADSTTGRNLLAETEVNLCKLGHLVNDPFLWWMLLDHGEILEDSLDNLLVILETVLGNTETIGPALCLDVSENRARAFVTNKVAEVLGWLRLPKILLVGINEVHIEQAHVHDGLDKDLGAQLGLCHGGYTIPAQLGQFVQLLTTKNSKLHAVGRVVCAVEVDELVANLDATSNGIIVQDLVVADSCSVGVDANCLPAGSSCSPSRRHATRDPACLQGIAERGLRLLNGQGFGAAQRRLLAGGGGRGRELKVVLVVFVLDGKLHRCSTA
ncbi:putative metalloprotease, partial [Aureobasidium melanogenum]